MILSNKNIFTESDTSPEKLIRNSTFWNRYIEYYHIMFDDDDLSDNSFFPIVIISYANYKWRSRELFADRTVYISIIMYLCSYPAKTNWTQITIFDFFI